jgi:hypothetical protein
MEMVMSMHNSTDYSRRRAISFLHATYLSADAMLSRRSPAKHNREVGNAPSQRFNRWPAEGAMDFLYELHQAPAATRLFASCSV